MVRYCWFYSCVVLHFISQFPHGQFFWECVWYNVTTQFLWYVNPYIRRYNNSHFLKMIIWKGNSHDMIFMVKISVTNSSTVVNFHPLKSMVQNYIFIWSSNPEKLLLFQDFIVGKKYTVALTNNAQITEIGHWNDWLQKGPFSFYNFFCARSLQRKSPKVKSNFADTNAKISFNLLLLHCVRSHGVCDCSTLTI